MIVKDLIAVLQASPQDARVYIHHAQAEDTGETNGVRVINSPKEAPYCKGDNPLEERCFKPTFPAVVIDGAL